MIPFAKGHGLGNDYIVLDEADLSRPLSTDAIGRICDRNWGVGSDGILLLVPSRRADFGLRIFNPDGSEAEKSGNGLRIFAKYLWDHGRAKKATFTVDTKGGVVECQCRVEGGRVGFVTVEMGRATFRAPEIPMNGPDREVVGVPLQLGNGTTLAVTAVSIGNPHCVTFVERLDEGECRRLGPLIERHPAFPNVRNGLCDHGRVKVRMPGGELAIDVRADWSLRLEGPVEEVYRGTLSAEFAATL